MSNVAILMITYNRLDYTKKSLDALINCGCNISIIVIDNASTDDTQDYLIKIAKKSNLRLILNKKNHGIAGAMNQFLHYTPYFEFVAKVDNDTIVPKGWIDNMMPHMEKVDIVQAKHHIIPATDPNGWQGFTKNMKRDGSLLFNHFVGGSGILCRRSVLSEIPVTEWKLGGWRQWQREHPNVKKAFCDNVEIKLLDEAGYNDYPEYYKETKRL